ncbi:MAG: aldehyde dehydrogenase family protein, partial [Neoaquamicrobium sediminum]
ALASASQLADVRKRARELSTEARLAFGSIDSVEVTGDAAGLGAFISPLLFRADDPWSAGLIHDVEAFGPVSTLMPYKDLDDAIALANR